MAATDREVGDRTNEVDADNDCPQSSGADEVFGWSRAKSVQAVTARETCMPSAISVKVLLRSLIVLQLFTSCSCIVVQRVACT